MEQRHMALLGALIGLARATDGNEHLISPSSTALVRECLRAAAEGTAATEPLMDRIEAEKQKMVPDCFLCAAPRGKTAAFDLGKLSEEESGIRSKKHNLIDALCRGGATAREQILYNVLNAVGIEGCPAQILDELIGELNR